jgi:hypothetical protein
MASGVLVNEELQASADRADLKFSRPECYFDAPRVSKRSRPGQALEAALDTAE